MAVKAALNDARFREMLPSDLEKAVTKFLKNPTCPCNVPLYRKILKDCKEQLAEYYPNREVTEESADVAHLAENHWTVINCNVSELEAKLKLLGPGRKQVAVTRYEDQATVIINDLEYF